MSKTMTVRNVSDDLHARLGALARAERRSLNAEVLALLEAALDRPGGTRGQVDAVLAEADRLRERIGPGRRGLDSVHILRRSRSERGGP